MSARRSCACQHRLHEHGCRRRYIQSCRCQPCTRTHTAAVKLWRHRNHHNPSSMIDGTGTRRRLQALTINGYSAPQLAKHLGVNRQRVHQMITRDRRVHPATANQVAELFTELCWQLSDAPLAGKTRRHAQQLGYMPALAWDDIDDPAEQPNLGDPKAPINQVDEAAVSRAMDGDPPTPFRDVDKREAVFRLHKNGITKGDIARRLRMNRDAVDQYFARARRASMEQEDAA